MSRLPLLSTVYPAWHIVKFDNVPVYRGLAWALQDARNNGWKGHLVSADRRVSTIKSFNKRHKTKLHDQAYLFNGWTKRLPGFLPANPPTQGSHLLLGDGTIGHVGHKLRPYQLGLDVTEWDDLLRVLHRYGYKVHQPYHTASEAHHVNFAASPAKLARRRLNAHASRLHRHKKSPRK
ncbi:hypothetical protein [Candidatus Solirubrobacter pratensis]|uniref:hypothetical protein n=1 Tax=Candidatus Solirubrobacter pratensis TaxID=1298857 RepID=UPI000481DEE9|nr:hypothetical protein [Candidatus Solirubrobacter pratensis]